MSQSEHILKWLKSGGVLTPLDALELFNCLSLSQRIGGLKRKGHPIRSELIETDSGKHVAKYSYDWKAYSESLP